MKMYCYKISKYNPEKFKNGIYQADEWTDYSDIGKNFGYKVLTMDEYLKIEKNYINLILKIVEQTVSSALIIEGLENYDEVIWKNNQRISGAQLEQLIQDCLRNRCWCKVKSENFCLCFGYDFYIHICCCIPSKCIKKLCDEFSLFLHTPFSQVCKI